MNGNTKTQESSEIYKKNIYGLTVSLHVCVLRFVSFTPWNAHVFCVAASVANNG